MGNFWEDRFYNLILGVQTHTVQVFLKCVESWPTEDTAIYVTFEGQKLRGQFSENLVLRIYEFLFNSGGKISKEKRIMKVLRIKN